MGVEWCWETTRRMSKNDEWFGNTLRALGNMSKDTKKRAKYIFCFVLFPSIGSTQKGIGILFFLVLKTIARGIAKDIEKLKSI
jgi:hypothetical protein